MRTYTCDYAAIDPQTLVEAVEYALPGASAIWKDIDEESFKVTVYGADERLDEILEPYLYTHPADWDDCDYECGFDPYCGCYTDDC